MPFLNRVRADFRRPLCEPAAVSAASLKAQPEPCTPRHLIEQVLGRVYRLDLFVSPISGVVLRYRLSLVTEPVAP
jgi:hypothetical protein